jgi:hypothetical protein
MKRLPAKWQALWRQTLGISVIASGASLKSGIVDAGPPATIAEIDC